MFQKIVLRDYILILALYTVSTCKFTKIWYQIYHVNYCFKHFKLLKISNIFHLYVLFIFIIYHNLIVNQADKKIIIFLSWFLFYPYLLIVSCRIEEIIYWKSAKFKSKNTPEKTLCIYIYLWYRGKTDGQICSWLLG